MKKCNIPIPEKIFQSKYPLAKKKLVKRTIKQSVCNISNEISMISKENALKKWFLKYMYVYSTKKLNDL